MQITLTRRSSLLPNDVSVFGSGLFDSVSASFFTDSIFPLGGGGGLVSCVALGSFFGESWGSEDVCCLLGACSLGCSFAATLSPLSLGGAPSSNFNRSWPTVTVSSSFARSSFIVPASGALTATSI